MQRLWIAAVVTAALWPSAAPAADGRIEINQAVVEAAGGFPYVLSGPGSYVLTGPLTVPASTDGLRLGNEVVLDLNGFSITGPATCAASGCAAGTGLGIRGNHPSLDGNACTVRNGTIRGFAGGCLSLSHDVRVEDLDVSQCGDFGIGVGLRGLVRDNRVRLTRRTGINMSSGTVFAHNTVSLAGRGGGGEPAVAGGVASAGNFCDDGSCSSSPTRRYFLTKQVFAANAILTACPVGFHTASLWEIFHTATLRYDTERGYARQDTPFPDDSGKGPPAFPGISAFTWGWIRTGASSSSVHNCLVWTVTDASLKGMIVSLGDDWDSTLQAQRISPWTSRQSACNNAHRVWCVQD